jgi:hypothetical protein
MREAQQRAQDAQDAILAADAAAAQARARRDEMDIDAEQSAILGADESVRAAEARAAIARREAADAATDLAEAGKGEFKKAKTAAKEKVGGNSELSGVGGIFGSFLKETLGIGDFLPGLESLMPLQMANTAFGAFTTGYASAKDQGLMLDGGTSMSAFGLPDISAPPMPDGMQHTGAGGAPGPANIINVDQSQNFNNSPVGSDPVEVERVRQNNINRAPRLPVGVS